jgi:hypothetical protein
MGMPPSGGGPTTSTQQSVAASVPPGVTPSSDDATTIATIVLAIALVGVGIFLLVSSTKLWFNLDEWDFLAHRGLNFSGQGILYPHNEHWTTIPILVWRGIFGLVGVRDYWFYSLPMILAHLATVILLWRFMLRHEVELWTATLLAVAFAVVGVGGGNLIWAFQLTFVGSVAFGMLAIDAIETERTWLAPLWLICSLMCSDLGLPMIAACALVALAHRKFRVAVIAVVPPIVVFVIWYVTIGNKGTAGDYGKVDIGQLLNYVWTGLTSALSGFFDAPHAIGVVAILVLAAAGIRYRNAPAALAAAVLPFYGFVGLGRVQDGAHQATSSRYSYLAIALVLPLIGWSFTRLLRVIALRPLAIAGLVALVALNLSLLHRQEERAAAASDQTVGNPQMFLAYSNQKPQMEAAAFLLAHGKVFPGQFPANSVCAVVPNAKQCVVEDVPDISTLSRWVQKGQFPVPTHVAPGVLAAEESVLNVSVSMTPRYPQSLGLQSEGRCIAGSAYSPVKVTSSSPTSFHLHVAPWERYLVVTVTFPDRDRANNGSTLVHLPVGSSWLNVPFGHFSTAVIASLHPIQVCQGP